MLNSLSSPGYDVLQSDSNDGLYLLHVQRALLGSVRMIDAIFILLHILSDFFPVERSGHGLISGWHVVFSLPLTVDFSLLTLPPIPLGCSCLHHLLVP